MHMLIKYCMAIPLDDNSYCPSAVRGEKKGLISAVSDLYALD